MTPMSYEEYLELQKASGDEVRHDLEKAYYENCWVACKGQIEKINKAKGRICFERVYLDIFSCDGNGFMGKEDHVWMECSGFESYKAGDNLSFTAEIYRYVKTGNGKMLDFGLRNPQGIRKIGGGYDLLSDEELELQAADEFICRELCLYKEHCYGTACLADADWRKTMRKELSGLENRKESRWHVGRHREMKVRYIGPNQGDAFTNNKVYEVIDVQVPWLRIIDDSEAEEDYIYLINEPRLLDSSVSGKFEIVEDDEKGTLHQAFEELRKLIADYNSSSAGRKSPLKQVG